MLATTRLPRVRRAAGALLAVTAMTLTGVSAAHATVDPTTGVDNGDASLSAFYVPPSTLPAGHGKIVRTESIPVFWSVFPTAVPARVNRIMYTSTDRLGNPIAVTGTVFMPYTPWLGGGSRPLIAYGPGTQGLSDTCAPSWSGASGFEYEGLTITGLVAAGYAVAMTDYQGLGTPGGHTYMDRVSQGHAVLDVALAAQKLTSLGYPAHGPVAIMGYSQGGGAAASAAELAGSYARTLDVKGTAAGATPADLALTAQNLDGSVYSMLAGYAVNGLATSYHVWEPSYANGAGLSYLNAIARTCVTSMPFYGFRNWSDLTSTGQTLTQFLRTEPMKTIVNQQRIGRIKPSAPVLVFASVNDDTIPYQNSTGMAAGWCAKGGAVDLELGSVPTHIAAMPEFATHAMPFLNKVLTGQPVPNTC